MTLFVAVIFWTFCVAVGLAAAVFVVRRGLHLPRRQRELELQRVRARGER